MPQLGRSPHPPAPPRGEEVQPSRRWEHLPKVIRTEYKKRRVEESAQIVSMHITVKQLGESTDAYLKAVSNAGGLQGAPTDDSLPSDCLE